MLTLVCGIPNAGKTTYSSRFEDDVKVVHIDDVEPVERSRMRPVLSILRETDDDIMLDGTFVSSSNRRQVLKAYGGIGKCIWFDTPLEECIARENRGRPISLVKNSHAVFEPPTYKEGWDEIWVLRGGELVYVEKKADMLADVMDTVLCPHEQ